MSPKVTSQSSYEIPKVQRAAVFEKHNGPVTIRTDWPVEQKLSPGQVLVRIVASGVCHTDLHVAKGDWPVDSIVPLVGGHEGAGYVCAIADNTPTDLKIGDAVGLKWMASSCLSCEECRKTNESSCSKIKNHGYTEHGPFQEFCVSWATHVTPIPDGMSLFDAAPILCAGVTVYKALKTANLTAGESVVITGAGGGLGHLAVQYARYMGYSVIAVDSGDAKRDMCTSLGADHFLDFKTVNVVEEITKLTNGGAHAAIVVASGAAAYNQALEYLRPNGALVAVGLPKDASINAQIFSTVVKSLRILGSYVGNRQDSIEALQIAAAGHVKTTYTIEPLEALPEVYEKMENLTLLGKVILDTQ